MVARHPGRTRTGFVLKVGMISTAMLAVLALGTWRTQAADEAAPATGLQGILPQQVPDDLTASIAQLPPSWQPWGELLTGQLNALYAAENSTAASQRAAIAGLRVKLTTLKNSLADRKYAVVASILADLYGKLSRRVDLATAVLDTVEVGPEAHAARISEARAQVERSAQAAEQFLNGIPNGKAWLPYLRLQNVSQTVRSGDPSQAVPVLTAIHTKLSVPQTDQKIRDFLAKPAFTELEQSLEAYLHVAKMAPVEPNNPQLRQALTDLVAGVEEYEAQRSKSFTSALRKAYDSVRAASPDAGARITQVLRTDYLNYNLRVIVSNTFMNKLVAQHRDENGAVNDFVLGAKVDGYQTTDTNVSVALVPSSKMAKFDLIVKGATSSNTQGVTPEAVVYTMGNHYFTAEKEVGFDGDRFFTQPARIAVSANNSTYGANTKYSRVPLLGGVANRIAVREAEKMRPESEAIARGRVQDRVLPEFDAEVNKEFGPNGTSARKLRERISALQELGLYPDAKQYSTTVSALNVTTRLMNPNEVGGGNLNPAVQPGKGLSAQIHESLMNNSMDRMNLAGRTMTGDQVRAEFEARLSKLTGTPVKLIPPPSNHPEADKTELTLVFDETDPIRFRIADGMLYLSVKAAFKQEDKEEIPAQLITMPFKFSVKGKTVLVERGKVEVSPVVKPAGGEIAKQITRAGVIKKKFEDALAPRSLDSRVIIPRDNKTKVNADVTRITAADGWLQVEME